MHGSSSTAPKAREGRESEQSEARKDAGMTIEEVAIVVSQIRIDWGA
jgi:hypothetical protein